MKRLKGRLQRKSGARPGSKVKRNNNNNNNNNNIKIHIIYLNYFG